MKKLFSGLLGGLAFESTLPVRADEDDFWSFVGRSYLYPVVGIVLGSLLGLLGVGLSYLPTFIGAGLGVLGYYLICGIIHTDGLADFADGLIVGGSHDERREVMKDEKTGAAGLVGVIVTNLLLFSALVELFSLGHLPTIFLVVLAAETLSKGTMLALLFFGESSHDGLGATFMEAVNPVDMVLGAVVTMASLALFRGPGAFLALGLLVVLVPLFVWLGGRVIGGISGDIVGAGGEIARPLGMISLILLNQFGLLGVVW